MSLFNRVSECFVPAQRSSATHAKMVQKLKLVYVNHNPDFEEFMTCVKKCVHVSLRQDYKIDNPFVDRSVAFVSAFCVVMHEHHQQHVDPDTDSPVVTALVNYLIEASDMIYDTHRYRASQFICKIFRDLIGFDLTIDFCNSVQEGLLELMEDKISKIRVEAAAALAPLQDVNNAHCPIVAAYIHHMEYDSSSKVRRVCAEKVALNREIIPNLLGVSRDIDCKVRLAVHKRAAKYPSKFKIEQKQELIDTGRKDSENAVKTFVTSVLIPSWLQHYELNYMNLMSALRLDSTWEELEVTVSVCEFTALALFNVRPIEEFTNILQLNANKLVEFAEFNYDSALYWRLLLQFLRKKNNVVIEDYAPQLPHLCQYIKQFCLLHQNNTISGEDYNNANLEFKYKLKQLFHITLEYDFVDISCRSLMIELIKNVLTACTLDLEVVNVIILNLNIVMPDTKKQSMFICDIAGDLMYSSDADTMSKTALSAANHSQVSEVDTQPPTEKLNSTQDEYAISQLKTKYFTTEAELDEAVKNQHYIKASELKLQLDALRQQLNTALKANQTLPSVAEDEVVEEEVEDQEEEADGEGVVRETPKNPILLKKALTVMAGFLTSSKMKVLNSIVQTFKVNVIDELIHAEHMSVKIIAMRCLALCCTLDIHTAKLAIPTCYAIIMMHNRNAQNPLPAELVMICVGALVDPLILFGTKILANPQATNTADSTAISEQDNEVFTGGTSLSGIIREILDMFNDDNIKIQESAVRSICSFILTARIYSHGVISRLVVKFVLPISSDPESSRIQQYIGVMLGKLSQIPSSAEQLEKAIVPTMKIILKAPPNSPLSEVDVDHVGKLMIEICGQYPNANEIYFNLCTALLKELRDRPTSLNNLTYSKMLLLLKLSNSSKDQLNDIIAALDYLRDVIPDPKVIANITKLNTSITLQLDPEQSIVVQSPINENADNSSSSEEDSD